MLNQGRNYKVLNDFHINGYCVRHDSTVKVVRRNFENVIITSSAFSGEQEISISILAMYVDW